MAFIWAKLQGTLAAILVVIGAIASAWAIGRRTGGESARANAAELEQEIRKSADAAATVAQRSTAADRLRDGKF
jgi:hypothetical protein